MSASNLFIVYVTDGTASIEFYLHLFEMTPQFISPRLVEFQATAGMGVARGGGFYRFRQAAMATVGGLGLV